MKFNQTDDINYYNKDNLNSNNNIVNNEEKSNSNSIHIAKLKKDKSTKEMSDNEQYNNKNKRYSNVGTQEKHNYFSIDLIPNFKKQKVESIDESVLILRIKQSIFEPDYFISDYTKSLQEYIFTEWRRSR